MSKLGEKLGEGAGSEAFAFGDGRVIKLFGAGTPRGIIDHEVRITRAAAESGAPAPPVLDVVEVDGRIGIVFPHYDGPTILSMVERGDLSPRDAGVTLARVHHDLHCGQFEADVPTFRQWSVWSLDQLARNGVPRDVLTRVREVVMALPERGALCHGDLHVSNILMTRFGPMPIDWISAVNAEPGLDVARQHLTLTILIVPSRYEEARRQIDAAFLATYAALTKTTTTDLLALIEPYMMVMAAMRMLESGSSADERAMLMEYIRGK